LSLSKEIVVRYLAMKHLQLLSFSIADLRNCVKHGKLLQTHKHDLFHM